MLLVALAAPREAPTPTMEGLPPVDGPVIATGTVHFRVVLDPGGRVREISGLESCEH